MRLEAEAKAAKLAETAKEQALEDAKIAAKLAKDLIPTEKTHVDYANKTEIWE
jgi:uncharacterized membrane-anchored protein